MLNRIIVAFILTLFLSTSTLAQFNEFEAEYDWYTIKGEHVIVHFHEEAERTARVVLKIADEIWDPITSLYQHEPETVHFVIKDINDYSNGATFFFNNKIEIWATALDFELRGEHNWLRNVITHEFTHMVQIQSATKLGIRFPAVYFQFLNYEDKRRPDILYGFPNFIASYPISGMTMPMWFAEGTAQYQRRELDYDKWDTHRDMIIRSLVLENKMLTWNQMGVFNKTSIMNEAVYNSGFALTLYISQKYGEKALRDITHGLSSLTDYTIDGVIEDVIGIDGNQLYDEWIDYISKDYKARISDVLANEITGDKIADVGFGNFYPTFSPDGSKIIYVSNKDRDYFGPSNVYMYDVNRKDEKLILKNVSSAMSFTPDNKKIVYSKLTPDNPKYRVIHDLYIYDIEKEKETRLTNGVRAKNPNVSHDGKSIVFLFQKDGTTNLAAVDIDGKNYRQLTSFQNGEQVYNPKFSNDDSFVLFDYSYHHGRDIAKVNIDGTQFEFLFKSEFDNRNPVMGDSGKIYFASDRTGIFNLYSLDPGSGEQAQITNVTGGTFMPSIDSNGNITYAGFTADGYKIFYLPKRDQDEVDTSKQYVWTNNPPLDQSKPLGDMVEFNIESLKHFNDYDYPDVEKEKYSGFFSNLNFYPLLRFDNYNISNSGLDKIKPGVLIYSSDYLNRYSFFAGGTLNRNLERDLFLTLEYRDKIPLIHNLGIKPQLSIDLYSISRQTSADVGFGVDSTYSPPLIDYIIPVDVTYDLFEVDFAAKQKIITENTNVELRFIFSQYTATIGSFIIPERNNYLNPTTKDTYFIGRNLQLTFTHDDVEPTIDTDINPVGRKLELKYNYEMNKYNPNSEYEVSGGFLKAIYTDFNFHRLELNWKEYIEVAKNNTISAQLRLASILGPQVDDFFDFYLGGLIGMKSYPFYAISGNELAWLNLTYRFPLVKDIDAVLGHLYIDKIFFSVYGDIGNAWTGDFPGMNDFKKGAGAEIRIKMNSFYIFPTSIFFNAAYSFDKSTREVLGEIVTYGNEWRFYGGILFDFAF